MHKVSPSIPLHKLASHFANHHSSRPIAHETRSAFQQVKYPTGNQHRHDYFEIYLSNQGGGICSADGDRVELDSGFVCILPPGIIHSWADSTELDGFVARVPIHQAYALSRLPSLSPIVVSLKPSLRNHLLGLMSWIVDADDPSLEFCDELSFQRWRLLLDTLACTAGNRSSSRPVGPRDICTDFLTMLESKYRLHWGVGGYAKALGVSRSSLLRATQDRYDRSPAYLISQRTLKEAERLLVTSTKTCAQISDILGFTSQAEFTRSFARNYGTTPTNYRCDYQQQFKSSI